jgi:hypothetical protein
MEGAVVEEDEDAKLELEPIPHPNMTDTVPSDPATRSRMLADRADAQRRNKHREEEWKKRKARIAAGIKLRSKGNEKDAHLAASTAFVVCMPPLVNRASCKAFIACVAVALQRRYIALLDAKTMMYTAQLALAAHRPRLRRSGPWKTRGESQFVIP